MTRQEEIREKVGKYIDVYAEFGTNVLVGMILEYLHSQDVVIKVDRELPEPTFGITINGRNVSRKTTHCVAKSAHIQLIDAGYVAVESLIEEYPQPSPETNYVVGTDRG